MSGVVKTANEADEDIFEAAAVVGTSDAVSMAVDKRSESVKVEEERSSVRPSYSSESEDGVSISEGYSLTISVLEAVKMGDGLSSYHAYRIRTRVANCELFPSEELEVLRRFSDFLGLHERLQEKHLSRGRIIPAPPEKSVMSMTKAKMADVANSSSMMDVDQLEFLSRRRLALERFINRVASHPVLRRDALLIEFLSTAKSLPRAKSTSTISSASMLKLLNRVGDSMVHKMNHAASSSSSSSVIMEEQDPYYIEKLPHIDRLESQLRKVSNLAENLCVVRKELAAATGHLATSLATLATEEQSSAVSRALMQLSLVEQKSEQVHQVMTENDALYFADLFKDYLAQVAAVRETLMERTKALHTWNNAKLMVAKKKEQRARMEMSGEKLGAASEELIEWESRCAESRDRFLRISDVIKKELEFFEEARLSSFRKSFGRFIQSHMASQTNMIKHWEQFLPEVRAILY